MSADLLKDFLTSSTTFAILLVIMVLLYVFILKNDKVKSRR